MRVLFAIALLALGCSSSSTNNSNDEDGGTGGTDAASGGTGSKDSGSSGGSAGLVDASVPDGAAGRGGGDPCLGTRVVINEISTAGYAPADEFIELYNPGPDSVNLGAFNLDYSGVEGAGNDLLWDGGTDDIIASHGFFVIAGAQFVNPSNANFIGGMTLEASGGVRLRRPDGHDSVTWGDVNEFHVFTEGNAAQAPTAGTSIGRVPDGVDCDSNFFDFLTNPAPSPGDPNAS